MRGEAFEGDARLIPRCLDLLCVHHLGRTLAQHSERVAHECLSTWARHPAARHGLDLSQHPFDLWIDQHAHQCRTVGHVVAVLQRKNVEAFQPAGGCFVEARDQLHRAVVGCLAAAHGQAQTVRRQDDGARDIVRHLAARIGGQAADAGEAGLLEVAGALSGWHCMKRPQVLQQLPHRLWQQFEAVADLQRRTHQIWRGLHWPAVGIRPAIQLQQELCIAYGASRLDARARSGVRWH